MRFSLDPAAFSPAAAAVHKPKEEKKQTGFRSWNDSLMLCANKLNLLSASFAKSLLRSSSAVSLEKLSSPKGFQAG